MFYLMKQLSLIRKVLGTIKSIVHKISVKTYFLYFLVNFYSNSIIKLIKVLEEEEDGNIKKMRNLCRKP